MILSSHVRRLVGRLCLGACLLVSCDSGVVEPVVGLSTFEADGNAVHFVAGLRALQVKGQRPPIGDVQRLKTLGLKYPGTAVIEDVQQPLLTEMEDWDGLAEYLLSKSQLTNEERVVLTLVSIRQADYAAARTAIQPVADAAPTEVEVNALLGRSCYFLGDFAAASKVYDRIWAGLLSEGRVYDITYRAMIYFDAGETQRAFAILQSAEKAAPTSIVVLNALSRVATSQGKQQLAESYGARVAELQDELAAVTADSVKRASRVVALNGALQNGDLEGCERMIFTYLPDSSPEFRGELYQYLEKLYRRVGRDSELDSVLERAREVGERSGQ
jgi:tetratricopeptide (TPR) repeat protein